MHGKPEIVFNIFNAFNSNYPNLINFDMEHTKLYSMLGFLSIYLYFYSYLSVSMF